MSVTEPTNEEIVSAQPPLLKTSDEQDNSHIEDEPNAKEGHIDDEKKPQNGDSSVDVDHDAQGMVISSLRTQVQDLFSQVNQLNNKLVRSYDRVSDLEDSLHITSTNLQLSNQKINNLELEKSQHLSQLTSGSLVEKSHVTAELTRLMERATEEAAQRGQAVSAKEQIERELEELSASLFGEANSMVNEARVARSVSERKVEDAEGRLKEAEEAVRMMQNQMQNLMQEKEDGERNPGALTTTTPPEAGERLMKNHLAYHEYLAFLAHLRNLHISNPNAQPPAMATLLQLPFLSRLLNEDSEPTLRLDLAPSLNWLSRRSVLSAIHTGQLSVEPISTGTLFTLSMESPFITIAGMSPSSLNAMTAKLEDLEINIPCALCGSSIFPIDTKSTSSSNHHSTQQQSSPHFASVHITMPSHTTWSAAAGSFFRKPAIPLTRALSSTSTVNGVSTSGTSTPPLSNTTSTSVSKRQSHITPQTQIHIFRLASLPTSTSSALSSFTLPLPKTSSPSPSSPPPVSNPSSRPASSASSASSTTTTTVLATSQPTTYYPLCTSGWCLARLRTTCTLWSFIRTGIVEKVWDEELVLPSPASTVTSSSVPVEDLGSSKDLGHDENGREAGKKAPPLPPRRRGLWGIASAFGERAASWGEGASKEKREGNKPVVPDKNGHGINQMSTLTLPTPPPLPKRNANRSQSRRGDNSNSPSPVAQIDTSSPLTTKTATGHTSLTQAVDIPLPESRVGTPDGKTPTVSRTCSPAIPPPVPRRAAARTKGTKADEEEEVKKKDQDKEEEEVGGESVSAETTTVVPAEEEKLQEVVQQVTDGLTVPESESGGMNGIKTEEKESSRLEGEKPPTELDTRSDEEEQPMPTDTDASIKVDDDDDQTQYVGALIWEEKMWRELVRVRKEMFYARLGAC